MAEEFSPAQLKIIPFPHPGLRYVAKPIKRVDATLKQIVARMIELMYAHRGVGLAATQVNLPLRMFVWDPTGDPHSGRATVFLNPTITRPRSNEEAEEGCLSLPGINANVVRSKTIHMSAYDLSGKEIDQDFSGFEARILQHETDHLDGMLFLDRLSESQLREQEEALLILQTDFESRQRLKQIPSNAELIEAMTVWESRYC
jgi:peptide deformylase